MKRKKIFVMILSFSVFLSCCVSSLGNWGIKYAKASVVSEKQQQEKLNTISDFEFGNNGVYEKISVEAYHPYDEEKQISNRRNSKKSSLSESDSILSKFGAILNYEIQNYLKGMQSSVTIEDCDVNSNYPYITGLKSKVTFDLSEYKSMLPYNYTTASYMANWLYAAIGKYPNLSCLFTSARCEFSVKNGVNYISKISVDSPIESSQFVNVTNEYKEKLAGLIHIPQTDNSMTDVDKLLYLHDQISAQTEYSTDYQNDQTNAIWHTGIGMLLNHECVCQGYAVVFNNAAEMLGFDSEFLLSQTHGWNAVNLNGKWYNIDLTWDDTDSPHQLDSVDHSFFMVDFDAFTSNDSDYEAHKLDETVTSSKVMNQMGNTSDYEVYPRNQNISRKMSYLNGIWYYSDGNNILTWNRTNNVIKRQSDILSARNMSCDVYQGDLYYSNCFGLFKYVPNDTDIILELSLGITDMVIMDNEIVYNCNGIKKTYTLPAQEKYSLPEVDSFIEKSTATEEPTATNEPIATEEPKATNEPQATEKPIEESEKINTISEKKYTIKYILNGGINNKANVSSYFNGKTVTLKNPMRSGYLFNGWYQDVQYKKSIKKVTNKNITVYAKWKKVNKPKVNIDSINSGKKKLIIKWEKKSTVTGYQIIVSNDKKATKPVRTISIGKSVTKKEITGLKSNKKYFVRIRTYTKDSTGTKIYGSYSSWKSKKTK